MKKKNIFNRKFIELTGCIHNHTKYSYDARISLKKIFRAAKLNELDYITINDHNTYKAREDETYLKEKDLLVIIGAELNDQQRNNHYLVFGSDKILTGKSAAEYVEYYRKNGAIGFAAHPFEKRVSSQFRKYIWTDTKVNGFDGLEIWNFLSEWVARINPKINGLFLALFPSFFVTKPNRENLDYWDDLNREGLRKSAIGSVDCHQENHRKFGFHFKFLTHKSIFKTIRTNVLIEEKVNIGENDVLNALKLGNSYIVNYKMGVPYNFYAGIKGKKECAVFGEEIEFQEDLILFYRLPKMAGTTLYHNGKKIAKHYNDKGKFEIKEKGFYRLEITRFGRSWILTNNIYVV
jgi:PHP domain-containing protein